MSLNVPGGTAVSYSSIAGAVTGVALWALSTYAFRGQAVPAPVEGAAWVLIPAAVSGIAARLTRQATQPAASSQASGQLPVYRQRRVW